MMRAAPLVGEIIRSKSISMIRQLANLQRVQFRKENPWLSSRITVCNALTATVLRRLEASKNRERKRKNLHNAKPIVRQRLKAHLTKRRHDEGEVDDRRSCAFLISRIGFHFADKKTSPDCKMLYDWQDYQNSSAVRNSWGVENRR